MSLEGTILHGYRLESLIGTGACAQVYRARHCFLNRVCAIKILSRPAPQVIARFEREARALCKMEHEHVVRAFDFGRTRCGRPFLAMELLRGRTLQAEIERGPISTARILSIGTQIARGLDEAHRYRIVHRDLKPANVMLINDGGREVVKILDFGVARAPHQGTDLTMKEVILGTPRYMPPEQVLDASSATAASDLYALGVMLYEMLTGGRPPYTGDMMDVLEAKIACPVPPLDTDTGLELLVYKLLSKAPQQRPSCAQVIAGLEAIPKAPERDEITFEDQTNLCYVAQDTEHDQTRLDTIFDDFTLCPDTIFDGDAEATEHEPEETVLLSPPAAAAVLPPPVRRQAGSERLAVVLAAIALFLCASAVALAAVGVQRSLEEPTVVVVTTSR